MFQLLSIISFIYLTFSNTQATWPHSLRDYRWRRVDRKSVICFINKVMIQIYHIYDGWSFNIVWSFDFFNIFFIFFKEWSLRYSFSHSFKQLLEFYSFIWLVVFKERVHTFVRLWEQSNNTVGSFTCWKINKIFKPKMCILHFNITHTFFFLHKDI